MSTLLEYIVQSADRSFKDHPFNAADNLVLSKLSYMPFEHVVSDDIAAAPMPYHEVANTMFAYNDNKFVTLGVAFDETVSVYSMALANTTRYKETSVVGCVEVDQKEPAVQFGAQTYLLPDNTAVIVYRGTNDSIFGWKEDLDILARDGIPSYALALNYIKSVATQFPERKIILCGHSKGGHLALYVALNTEDAIRARLAGVYNNDGPGFDNYHMFSKPAYKEILPVYHHYIPDASLVGLMLAHDGDYKVIKSSEKLNGINQHDVTTWQISGTEIMEAENGLTDIGKMINVIMREIVLTVNPRQKEALDAVMNTLVAGTSQETLVGLMANFIPAVRGAVKAWVGIDRAQRLTFLGVFIKAGSYLLDTFKVVKHPALITTYRGQALLRRTLNSRG